MKGRSDEHICRRPRHSPAAGLHRFFEDELGRSVGIFGSYPLGSRNGDWVLMHDGRRLQFIGVLPAGDAGEDEVVTEVWLVESA